jgi:hypothetical protein
MVEGRLCWSARCAFFIPALVCCVPLSVEHACLHYIPSPAPLPCILLVYHGADLYALYASLTY